MMKWLKDGLSHHRNGNKGTGRLGGCIYKSLGPNFKDVSVPDLTNYSLEEARHKLLASNLSIGRIFPEGREGYKGTIINQEPKAGETVKELSPVNIYFSEDEPPADGDGIGNNPVTSGTARLLNLLSFPKGFNLEKPFN